MSQQKMSTSHASIGAPIGAGDCRGKKKKKALDGDGRCRFGKRTRGVR